MQEITVADLAKESGMNKDHLLVLMSRGCLPAGRKVGRNRMVPRQRCLELIANHVKGQDWAKAYAPKPSADNAYQSDIAEEINVTAIPAGWEDLV